MNWKFWKKKPPVEKPVRRNDFEILSPREKEIATLISTYWYTVIEDALTGIYKIPEVQDVQITPFGSVIIKLIVDGSYHKPVRNSILLFESGRVLKIET